MSNMSKWTVVNRRTSYCNNARAEIVGEREAGCQIVCVNISLSMRTVTTIEN